MSEAKVVRVEYVCTGNNGRSPVAETVARGHVISAYPGLTSNILVSSSGTRVAQNEGGVVDDYKRAEDLARRGIAYNRARSGLFNFGEVAFLEGTLFGDPNAAVRYEREEEFRKFVDGLGLKARAQFATEEAAQRDRFLAARGLSYKGRRKQLNPIPEGEFDALYVLPIGADNVRIALDDYEAFGALDNEMEGGELDTEKNAERRKARVYVVSLAGLIKQMEDIPNTFGSPDPAEHDRTFARVAELARLSIDKVVEREFR